MKIKMLEKILVLLFGFALFFGCIKDNSGDQAPDVVGYPRLYQLPNATEEHMMGYIIRTVDGHVVVIDGGRKGDADQLSELIRAGKENGTVDAWFITHPHGDHIDALVEIVNNHPEINVLNIYASMLDLELIQRYEPDAQAADGRYHVFFEENEDIFFELSLGDRFVFGDVTLKVLAVKNPDITDFRILNNSSAVFRVYTHEVSVLFLGDLNVPGGRRLLSQHKGTGNLRSDIVQIAHHGLNSGVYRDVYEEIAPSIALWPTLEYMWNYHTSLVRGWMEELEVYSIPSYRGLTKIELTQEGLRRIKERH